MTTCNSCTKECIDIMKEKRCERQLLKWIKLNQLLRFVYLAEIDKMIGGSSFSLFSLYAIDISMSLVCVDYDYSQ